MQIKRVPPIQPEYEIRLNAKEYDIILRILGKLPTNILKMKAGVDTDEVYGLYVQMKEALDAKT